MATFSGTSAGPVGPNDLWSQFTALLRASQQPSRAPTIQEYDADPSVAILRGETGIPMASGGMLSTPGAQQQAGPGVTPADRVNARAQAQADARLRSQVAPGTNPADLFGLGGGDWASAWRQATTPQDSLIGHLIRQQVSGPNVSSGLAGLFNSASGPYGQLQQAAAYTAPARNNRQARMYEADTAQDIAKMKYGTANRVLGQLSNLLANPNQMTGFETDYGASAMLRPTNLRRYF